MRASGLTVTVVGDRVAWTSSIPPPDELLKLARSQRDAIIALLAAEQAVERVPRLVERLAAALATSTPWQCVSAPHRAMEYFRGEATRRLSLLPDADAQKAEVLHAEANARRCGSAKAA